MHRPALNHALLCAALAIVLSPPGHALDTAFTYQGSLEDNGQPAGGSYDLQFTLLDDRNGVIGPVLVRDNVAVNGGVFTVELDFGALAFTGGDRLLRIGVRPGTATGSYTLLSPNAKVNPGPYAQLAGDALVAATVADGAINSAAITDGSVTAADVQDGSLGVADLGSGSVGTDEVIDQSLSGADLIDGGVGTNDLAINAVTGAKLASNAVSASHLVDGSVGTGKLAANAVTGDRIANDTITDADLAANTITGASIADLTITDADIAANTITGGSILNGTIMASDVAANQFWRANGNAGTTTANQYLGTNDGAPLRLQTEGGVGINVLSPRAQLHVAYNPAFANNQVAQFSGSDIDTNVQIAVGTNAPEIRFETGFTTGSIKYTPASFALGPSTLSLANAGSAANLHRTNSLAGVVTNFSLVTNNGTVIAEKPGGGAWSAPSDVRLKHDVQDLDGALDRLLQLRGVTFKYNDGGNGRYPAGVQTGFVAQEVQQVFPDWVDQGSDGYLLVGVRGFEALTVEALRELRAENAALRAESALMRTRLEQLEAKQR